MDAMNTNRKSSWSNALSAAASIALALSLDPGSAVAGAWGREPGSGYFKLSYSAFRAVEAFDQNGDTVDLEAAREGVTGDFLDLSLSTYVEYGLSNRATIVASLPIKATSNGNTPRTVGLGDLWVGIRSPVLQGPVVLSLSSNVKLPLYGQTNTTSPSLGTAKIDGDLRVLLGRSFWPLPFYATAEFGHRWRDAFSNQLFFSFELGSTPSESVLILVRMNRLNSRINPGSMVLDPSNPNLGDQDYTTIGGGLTIKTGSIGWALDVSTTITGRNTAKGFYIGGGLSREW